MRGVPATLQRDREDVLRHEDSEGRPGEDEGERPRVGHRDHVVGRQDQLGENDDEQCPVYDPCDDPPGGSARDEHERDTDQGDRERRDRQGWECVGSRLGEHGRIGGFQRYVEHPSDHPVRDHERREEHHEVPEASEDRERDDRSPPQDHDQRDGGEEVHGLGDVDEGRRSQIDRGVADGSVDAGQGTRRLADREQDAEQSDAEEPPRPPLPAGAAHERRRLARGAAAATGLPGSSGERAVLRHHGHGTPEMARARRSSCRARHRPPHRGGGGRRRTSARFR